MPADPLLKLRAFREAAERISSNLVELELDSSRQLLAASALTGESAVRWSQADATLTELWRRHGLLEELLERADRCRRAELGPLLEGPSIELAKADVPLPRRSLLGAAQAVERCSPDALVRGMSASFDEVKLVVAAIGEAWESLIPKLDAAGRMVAESERLASEVGEAGRNDLELAARELEQLRAAVTGDPLSVTVDAVDAAARSVRAIRDDLEDSLALKRGFDARMLAARELLEQVRSTAREARLAHDEVQVKISVPSTPPAVDESEELALELTRVADVAQQGAWREARQALERWTVRASERLEDARRTLAANRAPIEARNQFRALLEAYQVKAKRLGRLEDNELAAISARAHEALYSAPTDLARAAQLVRSYQQALSQEALS